MRRRNRNISRDLPTVPGIFFALSVLLAQLAAGDASATDFVADWNQVHQTMEGFGASDAFVDDPLTDAQADLYFSTTSGIGLSYLRMGIANDGGLNGGAWSDATKAAARGARVWAAPWTAPAIWKDNNSTSNGGHLCAASAQGTCTASHYVDWATRLASFASLLKSNSGVDLFALSVQNEPDFTASYDSMLVSNSEFVNFVNALGPKLAALNPRPKLMIGEYSNWSALWSLASSIESNPAALSSTDIYAAHQYSGVSAYQAHLKPLWQTEMSSFEGFDPSLANGVTVAKWIHSAITSGNVTAWHYWWLYNPYNEDNEGLIGHPADHGAITKRLYTLGNFSKFIRPGWVRIDLSGGSSANIFATAYKNPSTGDFALVVVNDSGSDVAFAANLVGLSLVSVTPWVTSASFNLQAQAPIVVSGNRISVQASYGVSTFVGRNDRIFSANFE
jgi:glucuronoarabinoxylan endo-1,4-beta-xylanase